MLNEEKIRLMTEIAMFEKKKGKQVFPYHKYFKSDYIGSRIMRSFFNYTLCALMCLLIWGLYNLDQNPQHHEFLRPDHTGKTAGRRLPGGAYPISGNYSSDCVLPLSECV